MSGTAEWSQQEVRRHCHWQPGQEGEWYLKGQNAQGKRAQEEAKATVFPMPPVPGQEGAELQGGGDGLSRGAACENGRTRHVCWEGVLGCAGFGMGGGGGGSGMCADI